MNHLATINQIPPSVALVSKALSMPKVKDMEDKELASSLVLIIERCFFESGQQAPSPETLVANANTISKDLKSFYPGTTIGEVDIYFRKGVRKEYGDYFGLNVVTFNNWIKSGILDDELIKAKDRLRTKIVPSRDFSEQERFDMSMNNLKSCWERFLSNGNPEDFGNCAYDFLDKNGKIPFNKERKEKIYEESKKEVIESKRQDRVSFNSSTRENAFRWLLNIELNGKNEFVVSAKKKALKIFFEELKSMDETPMGLF